MLKFEDNESAGEFFSTSCDEALFLLLSMQRTFVGVDFFSVFQEIYLQTNDPRVSNIVVFSDAVGELKVEVRCSIQWKVYCHENISYLLLLQRGSAYRYHKILQIWVI